MTHPPYKQFVLGLPSAGKTTFLAALWHVVVSEEVPESLILERLHTDHAYLNRIWDLWADVKPIERTKIGQEQVVSMLLKERDSDTSVELIFPDLSGEAFELQWTDRQMTVEYANYVRGTEGSLLFIHPEKVREEVLISETESIIKQMGGQQQVNDEDNESSPQGIGGQAQNTSSVIVWEAEKSPTQVQLVELLQFVEMINDVRPLKIGVIVSAWDKVPYQSNDLISPKCWVEERLPLLAQYLEANSDVYVTSFYGISAQGGRLDEAKKLREFQLPSDRIQVLTETGSQTHDITAPIRWLISQ